MNYGESVLNKIKLFLKSRTFLYILIFFICIFAAACCKDYDYDLYARFIVGENFFEKGVFNYSDYLSYTPTHKWFDHEYGASLVYYLFFKYLGPIGLVLIQGLLLFFTTFFVIKTQQIQKHTYPVSVFFTCIFILLLTHQNPSIIRCHMFSFVFFAMFLYFLEKTRLGYLNGKPSKILWLVPFFVVVWNNIHGGIVAGLGIIFIYMLGAIFTRQNWIQYFIVLTVSAPLLAINPYGVEYINFLVSANTKSRTMITEWWDVFAPRHIIYYYPQFFTVVLGLMTVLSEFIYRKKINVIKFLVLTATVFLGTIHVKLLSLPLITLFSLYCNEIINILDKRILRFLEKFAYLAAVAAICCIPLKHPDVPKTDIKKFPVKEVEFIKINNIKGNILTEFGLGSYVAYKLYPDNLIYFDGRYEEVYYDREFDKLIDFEKVENDWIAVLRDYPTEIILIDKKVPVYKLLKKLPGWVSIYEGDVCGIFIKKDRAKRYYKMPKDDIEYYRRNEFVNNGFFGKNPTR